MAPGPGLTRPTFELLGVVFRQPDGVHFLEKANFGAHSPGLHARCLRFAVTITRAHARLASGGDPTLPGGGHMPPAMGFTVRFQFRFSYFITSSSPKLS
jgi:hypothetical protein